MVKDLPANAGDARDMGLIPGSGRKQQTWSRKPQTTSIFLPGKVHGQRSLVDYSLRGHKESDMRPTEHTICTGRNMGTTKEARIISYCGARILLAILAR